MSGFLVISGAIERKNGFELGEGKYYGEAKLLKLNLETGQIETILKKSEGGQNYPAETPNLQYTACCLVDDILWLPTDTEVYKLHYPSLEVLTVISHPFFHNIHSVNVYDEKVYVSSTGLDLVAVFDYEGNLLERLNTEGKELWHRFSEDVDYRLVYSTRPHDSHPNFVFMLDGQPWVTRCRQQDAVNLDNVSESIELTIPEKRISVHDGVLFENNLYFTSVDGYILVCDIEKKKLVDEINLLSHLKGGKLGWCRGLNISSDGIAYIAFSRIRRTKVMDRLSWLIRGQLEKMNHIPASILMYDLKSRKVIHQYDIPMAEIDAIYGVAYSKS